MTEIPNLIAVESAVLVMDYQNMVLQMVPEQADAVVRATVGLLAAARAAGATIIFVKVGFRVGYPEISESNPMFAPLMNSGRMLDQDAGAAIHADLAPQETDIVVTKHRVSAFAGTDLDMILRARRIDTLILAGIATSFVVASTLTQATDADYRVIVARDCCADPDAELHQLLLTRHFPARATVADALQVAKMWGR